MIGVDEVGRGAWAGPMLVVAARQFNEIPGIIVDSKMLSKASREILVEAIIGCCQLGEGWVSASEIDEFGLTEATRMGVSRALKNLKAKSNETIIVDGHINFCPDNFTNSRCQIKADKSVSAVSAASIYAKVVRDRFMQQMADEYPEYCFDQNVGYGTKVHQAALAKYGVCKLHRQSYKPIAKIINND